MENAFYTGEFTSIRQMKQTEENKNIHRCVTCSDFSLSTEALSDWQRMLAQKGLFAASPKTMSKNSLSYCWDGETG